MLNFMKVPPTTYVMLYKYGKIKREGAGLSFFYYGPTSTIVAVPIPKPALADRHRRRTTRDRRAVAPRVSDAVRRRDFQRWH